MAVTGHCSCFDLIVLQGATKARLDVVNEVGNTTVSQLDSYSRHEQKRIHGVSDMKFEKNMDFFPSKNEADAAWHDNMVQVFLFNENFKSNTSAGHLAKKEKKNSCRSVYSY